MQNPIFIGKEKIPLVTNLDENINHDDYNTPNTSRVDEKTFSTPSCTDTPSTLQLRQKVAKQVKIS